MPYMDPMGYGYMCFPVAAKQHDATSTGWYLIQVVPWLLAVQRIPGTKKNEGFIR